jgi:hypothetical protein
MIVSLTNTTIGGPIVRAAFLPILLLALLVAPGQAQEHSSQQGHEGMSMSMEDSTLPAKLLADKRESEFNHRLAGFFVIVAGIFMLFQADLEKRSPWTRHVWPASFLVSGIFLAVWSDTELWPSGIGIGWRLCRTIPKCGNTRRTPSYC